MVTSIPNLFSVQISKLESVVTAVSMLHPPALHYFHSALDSTHKKDLHSLLLLLFLCLVLNHIKQCCFGSFILLKSMGDLSFWGLILLVLSSFPSPIMVYPTVSFSIEHLGWVHIFLRLKDFVVSVCVQISETFISFYLSITKVRLLGPAVVLCLTLWGLPGALAAVTLPNLTLWNSTGWFSSQHILDSCFSFLLLKPIFTILRDNTLQFDFKGHSCSWIFF